MSSETYLLYFIKDLVTPLQNVAFDAVSGYENLQPIWISGEEAVTKFQDHSPKNCCFIMGRFAGATYEHFKALGSSLYGPQVLLDYLREEKPLPNVSYPLFSTALRNAIVTVTSVTGLERERLFSSIEMLHGIASRDLTDDVNVIIAPKVGSKKYIVGASRGLHILTPDWIDEAWKLSETVDPIDMLQHSFILKFKLPIFAQLVICVSGLSLEERKEVAKIVSSNGGLYSGEMKIGITTHLVVKSAGGVKYNFAKKWKVRIVSVRWLTDSVNKGYALDESDYPVKEDNQQLLKCQFSTPTSSSSVNGPSVLGDISAITDSNCLKLDETRFSLKDLTNNGLPKRSAPEQTYLCGCVIFLYGCNSSESTKLSAIIQSGGGVLCANASDKVTESLTHVVLGADSQTVPPPDIEPGVFYVTSEWLESCNQQRKRVPESEFEAPFLLKTHATNEHASVEKPTESQVDTEEIRLINQYFENGGLNDVDDFISIDRNPEGSAGAMKVVTPKSSSIEEVTPLDVGLFSRLRFKPSPNFSLTANPSLSELISTDGGTLINDSAAAADYQICPYVMRQEVSSSMITVYWINSCVAAKTLLISELDTQIGFHPVYIPASARLPLEGCVISLSGYVGNDRTFLTEFARALGATVQECFLRKPVPSRNLAASTHLVAAKPDGRKFPASIQWGLPAVSCSWLYACATSGRRVSEKDHPVQEDDPMNPQDWSHISLPEKTQRPSLTFKSTPVGQSPGRKSAIGQLKTPAWVGASKQVETPSARSSDAFHVSPPLSEQVSRCLKTALSKTNMLPKRNLAETDFCEPTKNSGILVGVVACVAKSLSERQVELNNILKQLGGDFRWNFDSNVCTHMIACPSASMLTTASPMPPARHSTVPNPLAPDVQSALEHPRIRVVLPEWVYECQRQGKRLPEKDFAFQTDSGTTDASVKPPSPLQSTKSSLLGDVARRLESVMGSKAQQFTDEYGFGLGCGGDVIAKTPLSHRRSHRAPRPAPSVESGLSDISPSALANPPVEYALPGQALQVRWQYEDNINIKPEVPPPCPVNTTSNGPVQPPPASENLIAGRASAGTVPQRTADPKRLRVFSLSGVNQDERVRYQAIISELGGDLDPGMSIGEATTHLIIHAPSRCEKFLMCMASGKWILHKSYLDACATASTWLQEDAYEWGGPGTEPLLVQLSPAQNRSAPPGTLSPAQLRDLARAARYWRLAGGEAFADWRVIFGPGCDRETSFRRIIEIGGGKVLANSPPYPPADQVTHAFTKRRSSSSRSSAPPPPLPPGYEWLRVEFLCAHLTGRGSECRAEYLIKEADDAEVADAAPAAKRSRVAAR
uniref:BRCT domain-containing protein n=2 Tax=Mesocestoides corti TaxID=53468 RepID=A0A5K3EHW4_MESCO